jgi:hypothetical protein
LDALQNHHSHYVTITKDAKTALELVTRSPLSYRISMSEPSPKPSISSDTTEAAATPQGVAAAHDAGSPADKQFKLHIFSAPDYQHEFAAMSSPTAKSWLSSYTKSQSFMSTTLKQSLPDSVAAKGLAHWPTDFNGPGEESQESQRLRLKSILPSNMDADAWANESEGGHSQQAQEAEPLAGATHKSEVGDDAWSSLRRQVRQMR